MIACIFKITVAMIWAHMNILERNFTHKKYNYMPRLCIQALELHY